MRVAKPNRLNRTATDGVPGNRRIFKWLLSFSFDSFGNAIVYEYKREDVAGVPKRACERNRSIGAGRHIKRIRYGNRTPFNPSSVPAMNLEPSDFMFEAVFDYGEHASESEPVPVHEPYSSCRSGFEIRTFRLCRQVLMYHHFPEEPETGNGCLVGATEIAYAKEVPNASAYSFVSSVRQTGYIRNPAGGYDKKFL